MAALQPNYQEIAMEQVLLQQPLACFPDSVEMQQLMHTYVEHATTGLSAAKVADYALGLIGQSVKKRLERELTANVRVLTEMVHLKSKRYDKLSSDFKVDVDQQKIEIEKIKKGESDLIQVKPLAMAKVFVQKKFEIAPDDGELQNALHRVAEMHSRPTANYDNFSKCMRKVIDAFWGVFGCSDWQRVSKAAGGDKTVQDLIYLYDERYEDLSIQYKSLVNDVIQTSEAKKGTEEWVQTFVAMGMRAGTNMIIELALATFAPHIAATHRTVRHVIPLISYAAVHESASEPIKDMFMGLVPDSWLN